MWKVIVFLFLCQFGFGQIEKDSALIVLKEKCNICHKVEKPETIFTIQNMDMWSKKINRQVFIFKIMPKGEEVVLTDKEKVTLKKWIKLVKAKK